MKRAYMIPTTRWIDMEITGILTKSFDMNDDTPQGAGNSLGRSFGFGEDDNEEGEEF